MTALAGKVAIVTGASSGIGRAAALLFAREGACVVAGARRRAELDAVVAGIEAGGGRAAAVAGDVRDDAFAAALVETALGRFGGLDIAFNNAGMVGEMAPVHELAPEGWHDVVETNLTGAFLAARHQLPALLARGGGSLVFTASFVGYTVGIPGMAAYAAAKAGLIGLAKVIAAEYGARRIRANALLPGGTDTPMSVTRAPGTGPEVQAFVEGLHALKRMAEPDEIAKAALFLASDASSFVTGAAFLADGGVSVMRS